MNETMVTVTGNVAGEPRMRVTTSGVRVASFRLATTERRFSRDINGWRDGDTIFYTVTCWRTMAENVFSSVEKGQPMVVFGRLRDGSYEREGQRRTVFEIEAHALGHDMSRGVSDFKKAGPGHEVDREEVRALLDDEPFDPDTGELLGGAPGPAATEEFPAGVVPGGSGEAVRDDAA